MSPFSHILNPVESFHPRSVPLMARLSYLRELTSWWLLPLMLSGLQAGTITIFLKKTFMDVEGISPWQLDFAVSIVAASKAIGFLPSFLWSSFSRGRRKVRFMFGLQLATIAVVAAMAFIPTTFFGMWMIAALCIIAWTIWSGVITLRAGVWRANYADSYRPSIASRISIVDGVVMALAGIIIGKCLDLDPMMFRTLFLAMAAIGLLGATLYRRIPFRREKQHLADEKANDARRRPSMSPMVIARVLRDDPWYRGYLICMFCMGFGNLMLHPILAIALADMFDVGYLSGIAITTAIPAVFMILSIGFWGRRLENQHVIQFRAVHVWVFAACSLCVLLGTYFHEIALLYLGAAFLGVGWGGGVLAWNLGHQHFAPPDRDAEYMGVHISLTGIRGVIGPVLGVQLYLFLSPAIGQTNSFVTCFAICLATNIVGASGFVYLALMRYRAFGTSKSLV